MWKQSLIAAILATTASAPCLAAEGGNLTINLSGMKDSQGVMRVAIFNNEKSFKNSKHSGFGAFRRAVARINDLKEASVTFDNVPYGEYAVKCFHDENNNGAFETGILGMPKVEYGFSNNAHGTFGPASYEQAKFKLDQANMSMNIKVISP